MAENAKPVEKRRKLFRQEASPKHDLFALQEKHYNRIRECLGELATETYTPRSPSDWAEIHRKRYQELVLEENKNQTLLIDGSRGSGKTTLLVRLVNSWQRDLAKSGQEDLAKSRQEEKKEGFVGSVGIVPLRIIDLEVAPGGSSLLLQVAQTLRFAASSTLELEDKTPSKAWSKWQEFVRMAATSGAGQIETRRPNLDLESFTFELDESLPGYLDIRRTFYEFMDLLLPEFRKWAQIATQPLFVIGVDDADMSPHRSAELLEVTRVLRHPRLAFILTGDIDLFHAALQAHYLSLLRAPLQHRKFADDEVSILGDFKRAAGLAGDMLDKALPSHQRFRIDEIEPEFGLQQLGKEHLEQFTFEALKRGLKSPELGEAISHPSIYHYLEHDKLASRLFYGSIRTLSDLSGVIDAGGAPGPARIPDLFVRLWEVGLNRSGIPAHDRSVLEDAVRAEPVLRSDHGGNQARTQQTDPTGPRSALVVDPGSFEWEQVQAYDRSLVFAEEAALEYHLIRTTGVRVRYISREDRSSGLPGTLLSPVATGVLMLATDVAADHREWRIARAPGFGSRALSLVEVDYPWRGRTLSFAWPTVDWPAFIDHSALVERWDDWLDIFRERIDVCPLKLSLQFAYLVASVARYRFDEKIKPDTIDKAKVKTMLGHLDDTDALPPSPMSDATRDNALRRWRNALWLFTHREYGLGKRDRKEWRQLLQEYDSEARKRKREPPPEARLKEIVADLRLRNAFRALKKVEPTAQLTQAKRLIDEIGEDAPRKKAGEAVTTGSSQSG